MCLSPRPCAVSATPGPNQGGTRLQRRGLGLISESRLSGRIHLYGPLSFFSLLFSLSHADVSLIAPAAGSLTFVSNAVAAKWVLHETVDRRRLAGGGIRLLRRRPAQEVSPRFACDMLAPQIEAKPLPHEHSHSHLPAAPRESLSTQTLDQLIGWLKDGTFKSGSKLPSQNELVEYFGVSRTGVREALQMMAALNLIEIKPGLGRSS